MIDLNGLNEAQREAVMHGEGPCLVLATAGSGKTAVLTKRAARLIDEGNSAYRILLATFTRKAADEMRSRLSAMIGEDAAARPWIGTFHSHCLRMLKITYAECHWRPFEVLPPHKAMRLAREILGPRDDKHPYALDWPTDPKAVLGQLARLKADLRDLGAIDRYSDEAGGNGNRFIEFVRAYEKLKRERLLLDFDDFLYRTHQIFLTNADILARWQDAFDWILEDEVQDTMIAQHEIVKFLAAKHRNYFAVGDVNQSCFGFRGSDPEHTVMSFKVDYPESVIIKLPINYRSGAHIVETGANLIKHNSISHLYSLDPECARENGKKPVLFLSVDEDDEAEQIAQEIIDAVLISDRDYKDIAILYRVNAQSRALEDAMVRHQIPYVVNGSCGFYDRREVKDLLAYLQLASSPESPAGNEALARVINIPTNWFAVFGTPKTTHFLGNGFINSLDAVASRRSLSHFEALKYGDWKSWQDAGIGDFKDFVATVRAAGPTPLAMLMKARKIGYDEFVTREEGTSDENNDGTKFELMDSLLHVAREFENVPAFLDFVTQQRSRAKALAKGQDAVQLLTLHRAKGLEWPLVFMCGVSQGLLPHRRSIQWLDPDFKTRMLPKSIEEERRLCYVGVTRAKDELRISTLQEYLMQPLQRSPFLIEMGFPEPVMEGKEHGLVQVV
jgi:DNA helicase-2/ATP-dependent DNA helicase PcrA